MKSPTAKLIRIIGSFLLPALAISVVRSPITQQVIAQEVSIEDRRVEADRLFQEGLELRQRGEHDAAMETFQAALNIYEEVDAHEGQVDTLNQLGNVHLELNQHDQASAHYRQALAIRQQSEPSITNNAPPSSIISPTPERIIFRSPDVSVSAPATSGGTRSGPIIELPVALIPGTRYGQTTKPHPTLFLYLAEEDRQHYSGIKITFRLFESDKAGLTVPIYESTRAYPEGSGIFGIRLEELENIEPLALGKQYRWQIIVAADSQYLARAVVLENVIERVEPASPALQSAEIPLIDQPYVYAREGLWHDALSALIELIQHEPAGSQHVTNLRELLTSAGLEYVAIDNFIGYWSDEQQSPEVDEQQNSQVDETSRLREGFPPPADIGVPPQRTSGGTR